MNQLRAALRWLYGAWLTWRYVDEYSRFPAVVFPETLLRLRVDKHPDARWIATGRLCLHPWLGRHAASLHLDPHATLHIQRDTAIGPGVRLYISAHGRLVFGGREHETASGITADSVVMTRRLITIGPDCLIGWHTYITDSDWHPHGDQPVTVPTHIGRHTWIAHGVSVLKGSVIGDHCIVAANSTVTGQHSTRQLLTGTPARHRGPAPAWSRTLPPEA